ncbi:MAG: FAD-dependent oxidoreductase [Phycisphaeraceae bacterium]
MSTIHEPARDVPVCHECDVCVIGGSCTGIFAAIAAARQGARVAIVESLGYFGGTATASLVTVWHSHSDIHGERQIIAGLTTETMDRLKATGGVIERSPAEPSWQYAFAPYQLVLELDRMVVDAGVRPFLHTRFVAPVLRGEGEVDAIIIEDKTGRRAIKASMFVDASGDGDLVHRMGLETYRGGQLQPPTTCFLVDGLGRLQKEQGIDVRKVLFNPEDPEALRPGFFWGAPIPGGEPDSDMRLVAGTRVHGADCSDADELTQAEIEGRRQVRQMLHLIRTRIPGGDKLALHGLPARIGIRDTRRTRCLHQLTEREVLTGERFDDAIANGSYRVDVHAADGDGLVFRYLDGREVTAYADGRHESRRWAAEGEANASFYQIPYRSLVPVRARNVLVAGRCLDADEGAFGAVRVMVNTTQTGQAAGAAAWLALDGNTTVDQVDPQALRSLLTRQGAVII